MLNLDPQNPEALNGLDRVVDEYINLMDNALRGDDIDSARNYLRKGKNVNPNQYAIADAEERLNAAVEAKQNALRQKALMEQQALRRQQAQRISEEQAIQKEDPLVSSSDKQKLEELKSKLRDNPKDRATRKELKQIADKYQTKIKTALQDKDFDLAEGYVLEILEMTPEKSKAYKELTELLGKIRARK